MFHSISTPRLPASSSTLKRKAGSLRMVCGVACFLGICGFAADPAMSQRRVEVRPRIETERLEPHIRDLDGLSLREREEVIRRIRDNLRTGLDESVQKRGRPLHGTSIEGLFTLAKPHRDLHSKITLDLAPADRQTPHYIRWVQEALNQATGAMLPVDGVLSAGTREAIRDFQRTNGLVPDGVVGSKTESKLKELAHSSPQDPFAAEIGRMLSLRYGNLSMAHSPGPEKRVVFLDVNNRDGRISVTARTGPDYWFHLLGLPEYSKAKTRDVSSLAELETMIGDAATVVHRGDELPTEWQDQLQQKSTYLRNSDRSPKKDLSEFTNAAHLLERTAEPGKTRILSALPRARDTKELLRELGRMDLDKSEVAAWQQLQDEMDRVQTDSGFTFEAGTKDAFLHELKEGTNDYVVLIAHFDDERLHFPGGATLTLAELAVQRAEAPQRTVIILSCSAGSVNGHLPSLSETVIKGNMAINAVAHSEPISAAQVPAMMREFLIARKTIKEVFSTRGFQSVTENIEIRSRAGDEIAYLFPAR
jgi:hypothetical protein